MSPKEANLALADLSAVDAENPWPGLVSFSEADQRWFQGRKEETAELLKTVKRERMTVLFALSGIGKSSLLQAGLFPALRRDDIFPIYIRLDYASKTLDLRVQVLEGIAQAAAAADVKIPVAREGETLWQYFNRVDADFWNRQQRRVLPLIVFDQFEEIFTLGASDDRAQASEAFLDELADLAEGTPPTSLVQRWAANPSEKDEYTDDGEYKLLISLREDFLADLADQHRRIARVPHETYRIRQMNGEGALLAVSQAKDLIDETVAREIVRFVAGGERVGMAPLKELAVEPALLSVVCRELNNRRRDLGHRKITADLLEGNREQVLSDFYNRGLTGMDQRVRTFIEEQLITRAGARNSVALDDALVAPGMSAAIIETLVERRLLRKEFRRNEVRVELTHDRLKDVVRASREIRRKEEEEQKRIREMEAQKQKLRRNQMIMAGFAVIAFIAVGLAGWAFEQQRVARAATDVAQQERVKAEQQTELAKVQTKLAEEQTKRAVAAMSDADREKLAKQEEARQKEQERLRAEQNAIEAQKNLAIAKKNEQLAKQSSQEAQKSAEDARKAQEAEQKKALEADIARKNAEESDKKTKEEQKKVSTANVQIQRDMAKNVANEAVNLINASQFPRAMGDVARALVLDPNNIAARSLAFDALLRRPAVDANQPAARQFIHPALTHPAQVYFAVFSPDGRSVATGSRDGKIRIWDWQQGAAVELVGSTQPVLSVAYSPDGRRIAGAYYDKSARVFDVSSHSQVAELKHDQPVLSVAFSRDGRKIVTSSQDHTAKVWDAASGAPSGAPLKHDQSVNSAAFSPDGSKVVTASGAQAHVWDLASGKELFQLSHSAEVKSAQFSPDGSMIVTASTDNTARVWETGGQHLPVGDVMKHNGNVLFAAFSPDSKRVATASKDGAARVWEVATGRAITGPLQHKGQVLSASFSPDGKRLVSASEDRTAQVWDVWYDFGDVSDLVKALEGVSGFDGSVDGLGNLSAADKAKRLSDAKASQQPVLRWFFTLHP